MLQTSGKNIARNAQLLLEIGETAGTIHGG